MALWAALAVGVLRVPAAMAAIQETHRLVVARAAAAAMAALRRPTPALQRVPQEAMASAALAVALLETQAALEQQALAAVAAAGHLQLALQITAAQALLGRYGRKRLTHPRQALVVAAAAQPATLRPPAVSAARAVFMVAAVVAGGRTPRLGLAAQAKTALSSSLGIHKRAKPCH